MADARTAYMTVATRMRSRYKQRSNMAGGRRGSAAGTDTMRQLLALYERKVQALRRLGLEWQLTDDQIDTAIQRAFTQVTGRSRPALRLLRLLTKMFLCVLCACVCVHLLLTFHKTSYNFAVRNVQELIYPSMKFLRWLSLPLVRTFPSITVWYDELCLLENPYFRPVGINCWPCEDVRSILDLTGTGNPRDYQPHSAFPYIVKGASTQVTYAHIANMYRTHQTMLDRDAGRISSSVQGWRSIADVMRHDLQHNPTPDGAAHVTWRLNRLEPARAARRLFRRPHFLPNSVNVERFVLIDEPNAPQYPLPFPEGYKVFVMQGSGERLLVLEPVQDCARNCTRVSVLMKPSYFLYYNSWFYRPKSSPVVNSSSIAVTYIGSH